MRAWDLSSHGHGIVLKFVRVLRHEVLALALLAAPGPAQAWESAPQEVGQAASEELHRFTAGIPDRDLTRYGFPRPGNKTQARLKGGIHVYTIHPRRILARDNGMQASALKMIRSTDMWFFPAVADGRCDMRDWLIFGKGWGRTDCP